MMNPLNHFGISKDKYSKNMPMAGRQAPLHPKGHEYFSSKEQRDARYNELKGMGETLRKRSHGNTILDPLYVEDSGHTVDLGLGNEKYHYKKLYSIEKPVGHDRRIIAFSGRCKHCKSQDLVQQSGKIHCPECGRLQ